MAGGRIESADGVRLAVRRVGQGPPIVMLHGSQGGLDSWAGVAELLAGEYRSWLVARRGYHPSDVPAGPKSFAQEVADVHAVVRAAHRASHLPVHLVGASYGATLALHAVDLVSTGDLAAAARLFAREVAQAPPAVLAMLAEPSGAPAESDQARRQAVGTLRDLEALADDSADVHRWARIDVPVLLMQGADTWAPMPAIVAALAAVLPDVERVVWPGQTHFATATAPDVVAGALRDFLGRRNHGRR